MLLAEFNDLFFSRGGVRFRIGKHQLLGGRIVDSVGLDVKVVVVADDKCHLKKLLEPLTVSDPLSELNLARATCASSSATPVTLRAGFVVIVISSMETLELIR